MGNYKRRTNLERVETGGLQEGNDVYEIVTGIRVKIKPN